MFPQIAQNGGMNAFEPNGLRRELQQLSGDSGMHFRHFLSEAMLAKQNQSLHLDGPQMYRCQGAAVAYQEILGLIDSSVVPAHNEQNLSGIV